MGEIFRYMPVLQSRDAEFEVLRNLDMKQRILTQPIVSIVPPKWDFDKDRPACPLEKHVAKMALKFRSHWGPLHDIRVDGYLLDSPNLDRRQPHPMELFMDFARKFAVRMIPVTGLERSNDYQRLTSRWGRESGNGATIRIEREDLLDSAALASRIKSLLDSLKLTPDRTDIVFDVKTITETAEAVLADRIVKALSTLPFPHEWRSAYVAATSFPEHLSKIQRDSVGTIARLEWDLWKSIDSQRRRFARTPWFADYAIAHPVPLQIKNPRVSGNIRYTGESDWTILKGHLIEKGNSGQMHDLCRDLIARDEYCGREFSAGDRYIARCAERDVGPGNPTKWRFVGTSHHIGYVLRQLATHFEKTRRPRRVG